MDRPTFVYLVDAGQTINLAHVAYVIHEFAAETGKVDRVVFGDGGFVTAKSDGDKLALRRALLHLDMFDSQETEQ